MLLRCVSKVLWRINLERMKDALDERLQDEQAGFCKDLSSSDQIADPRVEHQVKHGLR